MIKRLSSTFYEDVQADVCVEDEEEDSDSADEDLPSIIGAGPSRYINMPYELPVDRSRIAVFKWGISFKGTESPELIMSFGES